LYLKGVRYRYHLTDTFELYKNQVGQNIEQRINYISELLLVSLYFRPPE